MCSAFESEADDETPGAELIKCGTKRRVVLDQDIPHAEFGLHLDRQFEKGKKEIGSSADINAGIAPCQF